MDLRQKRISNQITKKELARRRANGEDERKCFRILAKGSAEMSGNAK